MIRSPGGPCTRKSDIRYSVAKKIAKEENKKILLFPMHKQMSIILASIILYLANLSKNKEI